MIGIICQDDINIVGHSLFLNFRTALKNYLKVDFKDVKTVEDLEGISLLFIIDEHYSPHVTVWKDDFFINTLNKKNIRTIVFNFERIHSKSFPWNIDHQNKLLQIKNLEQLVSDVEDAKIYNKKIINKQYLSKDTKLIAPKKDKLNKVLFIGQVNNYYPTRKQVISEFNNLNIPFDIIVTGRRLSYIEFLNKLNEYRFILNPLGTGMFINLRFYEALDLGCIPIQQVTQDMSSWYYKDITKGISFISLDQINMDLLQRANISQEKMYLEDYFEEINFKSLL